MVATSCDLGILPSGLHRSGGLPCQNRITGDPRAVSGRFVLPDPTVCLAGARPISRTSCLTPWTSGTSRHAFGVLVAVSVCAYVPKAAETHSAAAVSSGGKNGHIPLIRGYQGVHGSARQSATSGGYPRQFFDKGVK
ncbi:hypothetical protein CTZ27_14850 [Streptomyces griseocarneus]|nr:hypothetical protein CTZ27_14850 [Streptomyces griseocarneus]